MVTPTRYAVIGASFVIEHLSPSAADHGAKTITHMSQDHSTISNGHDVAAAHRVPLLESETPPPPPPPSRPRATADFAASAAMAKDILSLGTDGEEEIEVPVAVEAARPQPVPDLDLISQAVPMTAGSPMAPDFFTARIKSKKRIWRFAR